jgi:hypothetical protein
VPQVLGRNHARLLAVENLRTHAVLFVGLAALAFSARLTALSVPLPALSVPLPALSVPLPALSVPVTAFSARMTEFSLPLTAALSRYAATIRSPGKTHTRGLRVCNLA